MSPLDIQFCKKVGSVLAETLLMLKLNTIDQKTNPIETAATVDVGFYF